MAASVRFDPSAPYEIDESDVPFARPGGVELLARVYRPRGEPAAPLGHPYRGMMADLEAGPDLGQIVVEHVDDPVHLRHGEHCSAFGWAAIG